MSISVTLDKTSGKGTPTQPADTYVNITFGANDTGDTVIHKLKLYSPRLDRYINFDILHQSYDIALKAELTNYDHNSNQVPPQGKTVRLLIYGNTDWEASYDGYGVATRNPDLAAESGQASGPQDLGELNIADQSVYIYKGEEIPYIHNKTMKVSDFEKEGYMNAVNGVLYASDLYKYKVFFVPAGTSFSYSGRNATMNAALLVFHNLNKSLDTNINDGILPYDSTTKIHDVTIENAHISGNYNVNVDTFLFVNKQIANVNDIVFSNVVIGGKKQPQSLRLDSLIEEDPDESEQTVDEEIE